MFTPKFDKIVSAVVGLGVPGIIFLGILGGAGGAAAGAAGLTAALSVFGPGGMIGGLISLPVAVLISKGIAEYGFEKILASVLKEMRKKGETQESLFKKIDKYPVSKKLKLSLKEEIINNF